MLGNIAQGLNETHEYLKDIGAKVAPGKSYNFASTPKAVSWLRKTIWKHIGTTIEVTSDFRYLGAHITTRQTPTRATAEARWEKAIVQLKRLRSCLATVQAKIGVILAKIYASAFYGIEAARVSPQKVAKLSAGVIDAFRSRNNNHNADRFFTTIGGDEKKDMDPIVQILGRRVLQFRRTCCKNPKAEARIKRTLLKYAHKHKQDSRWPSWFHDTDDTVEPKPPTVFPDVQAHPTTKDYDVNWDHEIDPQGPVGLLIEAAVWNGLAIDRKLRLWQKNEPPVSILTMPYQNLQSHVHMMATRARCKAEW